MVITPALVGVVLHPPPGLLTCRSLLDQPLRHQQPTLGQGNAAGRSEQAAPAEPGSVGSAVWVRRSVAMVSIPSGSIATDRGTVSWSCLVPVHGAAPLSRRWPADTRCPRQAEDHGSGRKRTGPPSRRRRSGASARRMDHCLRQSHHTGSAGNVNWARTCGLSVGASSHQETFAERRVPGSLLAGSESPFQKSSMSSVTPLLESPGCRHMANALEANRACERPSVDAPGEPATRITLL